MRLSRRRSSNSILSLNIPVETAINQEAVAVYKEREAKRQKLKEEQVCCVRQKLVFGRRGGGL
jgi:ubiquitin carboxyl-terminal hydrolase 5/13